MSASETNIWSSFLKASSKRSQNQEAAVLVVGHPSAGKGQLVQALCSSSAEKVDVAAGKQAVSYTYFDAEEKDLEAQTRINVWALGTKIIDKAFEILMPSYVNKVGAGAFNRHHLY
jgi:GTPase SAR1 family protein